RGAARSAGHPLRQEHHRRRGGGAHQVARARSDQHRRPGRGRQLQRLQRTGGAQRAAHQPPARPAAGREPRARAGLDARRRKRLDRRRDLHRRRAGGTDVITFRAKLLWQPSDMLRSQFMYEELDDRSPSPAAVNVTPTDPTPGTNVPYFVFAQLGLPGHLTGDPLGQAGITNRAGYLIDAQNGHHVTAEGYHLNTDLYLGAGTITWVQGYRSQNSSLPSNYTGVVGPVSVFDANRSDIRKTWQEEVRFASRQMGPFNYVAGLFYQHDDTRFCVAQILGIYVLFGLPTPAGAQPGG